MFKTLFSKEVTKANVLMTVAAAIVAVWEASDTIKKYRDQQESKELSK